MRLCSVPVDERVVVLWIRLGVCLSVVETENFCQSVILCLRSCGILEIVRNGVDKAEDTFCVMLSWALVRPRKRLSRTRRKARTVNELIRSKQQYHGKSGLRFSLPK
jgi:hypothetical protein